MQVPRACSDPSDFRYGPVLEVGDVLTLPTPEGEIAATVMDEKVEQDDGEESFLVQLDNGEKKIISYSFFGSNIQNIVEPFLFFSVLLNGRS